MSLKTMEASSLLLLLLYFVLTTGRVSVSAASNDPHQYFVGVDTTVTAKAYQDWYDNHGKSSYGRSIFLSPPGSDGTNGVALHWTIEKSSADKDATIRLAIASRAEGWVGFGLSESGGMRGSDIVYYTKESNELTDAYILDDWKSGPIQDDSCQNWRLIDSFTDDGFIIFETTRLLDTGDNQDRQLIHDDSYAEAKPTPVIVAWGDTATISYHGPTSRAKGMVRFFLEPDDVSRIESLFQETMEAEAEGYFDILSDYPIKAKDTIYRSFCSAASNMTEQGVPLNQSLHIIGVEPILKEETLPYLHHFTLYGRTQDYNISKKCRSDYTVDQLMYAWADGEPPMAVVPEAGFPLGGYTSEGTSADRWGYISFRLEIHYNNPALDDYNDTLWDKSGLRFYYTSKKRQYDMGMFTTGDSVMALNGSSIGDGVSEHTFTCPSSCTEFLLPPDGITIVQDNLHMHATGTVMTNEVIRDGKIIRQAKVEYFDFDQSGVFKVPQEQYKIMPGDSIRTKCHYQDAYRMDPESDKSVVFGYKGRDEMCIDFIFYYPRIYTDIDNIPGLSSLKGMLGPIFNFNCFYLMGFPFTCLARHSKVDSLDPSHILENRKFGTALASQYLADDSSSSKDASSSSSSLEEDMCRLPPTEFSSATTANHNHNMVVFATIIGTFVSIIVQFYIL